MDIFSFDLFTAGLVFLLALLGAVVILLVVSWLR